MEKRKYEDIQIIEVFHESKRQKICEYKSLIKENCFEGTQVFEYDEAGNLLKRTVIQNHSGSGQLRECCFAYDEEKRIIAYHTCKVVTKKSRPKWTALIISVILRGRRAAAWGTAAARSYRTARCGRNGGAWCTRPFPARP